MTHHHHRIKKQEEEEEKGKDMDDFHNMYFDKKDELLPNEGYFKIGYFITCFKELSIKAIPRILSYEFNLMTMSLINIYFLGIFTAPLRRHNINQYNSSRTKREQS